MNALTSGLPTELVAKYSSDPKAIRLSAEQLLPVKHRICVQCGQYKPIRAFWENETESVSLRCAPCRDKLRRPVYVKTSNPRLKRRSTMEPCDYDEQNPKIFCLDDSSLGDNRFDESKEEFI